MKTSFILTRPQMLRALPMHVGLAALFGAIAGFLLYFLDQISLSGSWNLILFFPMAAVYVNAAVLPIIVPGRHWTFGLIGMMMLVFLLIAGMVLASMFPFPHSRHPNGDLLTRVNQVTYFAIETGAFLGFFYGLLAGRTSSMVIGLGIGGLAGFLIGRMSLDFIWTGIHMILIGNRDQPYDKYGWIYWSPLHFAWQLALGLTLLHVAACVGAALGASPGPIQNPKSKIQN